MSPAPLGHYVAYMRTRISWSSTRCSYLPDIGVGALTATTPRWREVLAFMPGLFAEGTCTVGISARPSAPPEMKLYLERIGAVANDFSAR